MITVLTPPTSTQMASLATVKDELGITGTAQDAELTGYIERASAIISSYCQRKFAQATYRETVPGYGGTLLTLTHTPVVSVSQVLVDGSSPITDYTLEDPDAGLLYRKATWATGELVGWHMTPFFFPDRGHPNFTVDYVAGWKMPGETGSPRLPYDLEHAATELTKFMWRNKGEDLRVRSKSVDDLSLSFFDLGDLVVAAGIAQILIPYRRLGSV